MHRVEHSVAKRENGVLAVSALTGLRRVNRAARADISVVRRTAVAKRRGRRVARHNTRRRGYVRERCIGKERQAVGRFAAVHAPEVKADHADMRQTGGTGIQRHAGNLLQSAP